MLQEEAVKRERQEAAVERQMLLDLTQPETAADSHPLRTPPYSGISTPWATSERQDFYALKEMPNLRRLDSGGLHATSKEFTYNHLQERGVECRLKFKVRIVSRYLPHSANPDIQFIML